MTSIRRVGLVINPAAGQGFRKSAPAAREAIAHLGWPSLLTGRGTAGEDALRGLPMTVETLEVEGCQGRAYTQELIRRLVRAGVDALLVVGGDGTFADAAIVLVREQARVPVFGLGTGSTNAGMLVTSRAADLERLQADRLKIKAVPALLAYQDQQLLAVGFNDCVLGFTVVATIAGKLRDAAVAEKILGRNSPGRPAGIGTQQSRVWRSGPAGEELIATGGEIGTVIVGLAEPAFIAKALTGGVCLTSFSGIPAGCLVSSYPLVQVELGRADVLALPPIQTTYASLDSSMRVCVSGCKEGTGLCVDGNPLCLLKEEDEVQFSVIESAVQVFKISED